MEAKQFISLLLLFVVSSADWSSADSHTGFAIDLYKKIGKKNYGKNIFFSPISISTAFGMVHLGAGGDTKAQLKTVLKLNSFESDDAINEEFKRLQTTFKQQENNFTLYLVNRLFGSNEFTFRQEFLNNSQNYFQSSLESLDFKHKSDESRLRMNNWVSNQTNHKINDLLSGGSIDSGTALVIINVIYFNATWKYTFDPKDTKAGPFRISNSEQVQMDMMRRWGTYLNYYECQVLKIQILELPYLGDKASMFIFLPRDVDGLPRLEEKLTTENLNSLLTQVRREEVNVKLPKFLMDQSIPLKKFLQSLGITDLFDPIKSNLSGIAASSRLYASDAAHKAFVNVNEFGTEATGATYIAISATSFRPPPIEFTADRPFLFMISAKSTNTILFLGRLVRNPMSNEVIGRFGESAALSHSAPLISSSAYLPVSIILMIFSCMLMH